MTFEDAVAQAGPLSHVLVSKDTFALLLLDLGHRDPAPSWEGVSSATFSGIDILKSATMPDGMMALYREGVLVGLVSLEATPAVPKTG